MNEEFRNNTNEKTWATIAHVVALTGYISGIGFILGPLLVWLFKRHSSEFVNHHAKESLNFHISIMIYSFIAGLLCLVFIGFLLLPIIAIIQLVCTIIAAVKANDGIEYTYPLTIRFVR
ncbi:DUF4870 domain-containing protein [Priestia filamentosa]|uniref:DUF4870 domain-containing protein n=1 Tax=Priestia filamentosa TaxID=1402861 RepID=UPI00397D8968